MTKFVSQDKQDEFLENNIFKGLKHGIFVDIGAYDGISINNSLYFEKYNEWIGINVEPNPTIFKMLCKNRPNSINLECAVSLTTGNVEFLCNTGHSDVLSGIKRSYDPRHAERLENENGIYKCQTDTILVKSQTLEDILDTYGLDYVTYLSIDVEGGEMDVIKRINFDKVYIDVIGFESNYKDTSDIIVQYLNSKGYTVIGVGLDIMMIHVSRIYFPWKN